jgi:hypothetical protein
MLREDRGRRAEDLTTGKRKIVGVTAYANGSQTSASILDAGTDRPSLPGQRDAELAEGGD